MATFKSTTFGKISGKYGDALATQSKATGKNYLRVASVPSNPRTEKQVIHRSKFGFINSVLRPFYPVFKLNFGGNQGIRYAINYALKNAIIGEYPDFRISFQELRFSEGNIDIAASASVEVINGDTIRIDWDNTVLLNSDMLDRLNFVFYNENTDQTLLLQPVVNRLSATVQLDLPTVWQGAPIHCWLYFTQNEGAGFSNSQYVGVINK